MTRAAIAVTVLALTACVPAPQTATLRPNSEPLDTQSRACGALYGLLIDAEGRATTLTRGTPGFATDAQIACARDNNLPVRGVGG